MARRKPGARSLKGGTPRAHQPKRDNPDDDDEIPEVYRQLLAEEEERESSAQNDRPIKRRKVASNKSVDLSSQPVSGGGRSPDDGEDAGNPVQTAYDSTASDDSDMEWEDVAIEQPASSSVQATPISQDNDEPLQITFDQQKAKAKRTVTRRKPVSAAEKKLRLDVHKSHLLCLLRHVQIRNLWCNDDEVQRFLKRMLPKHVIALLNPPEDKPQFTRSTTFIDGLNHASEAFIRRFRVTKPGMTRAHWADDANSLKRRVESIMSNAEVILSKNDFIQQSKTLRGSRDFGAQLFCALLRSAAVEARLVCSLQPLPFSGVTNPVTPAKPELRYIVISSDEKETSTDDRSKSSSSAVTPQKARRLGRPQFTPSRPQTSTREGPRPVTPQTSYPVFWVEAFNEAVQKWIPVDPLVTKSLAKSFKFEPPASDPYNLMCYVVAFDEDASARDVTRRYAKTFNAKTRKLRVENTKNGEKWWAKAMEFYEKPFPEDRDELEIGELTAKTAAEGMPRNVQDFKGHPIYALERHLHRNEVISPKRVIGQVSLGKSGPKGQALEPVYRRGDVYTVRSADGWYRLGRDIKVGEQPLKHVAKNRNKAVGFDDDEEVADDAETPLYAHFQTKTYKPPPVVEGRIPKNVYGNLDIYVPTMTPPGGIHIKHPDAARAAKILGIDYAAAVTGFEFKGRHGTAVFQGVVIASEYLEALQEVLKCLEDERSQAELERKSAETLGLWRHFLLKLRIAERVKSYAIEGNEGDAEDIMDTSDTDYEELDDTAGGFIPEPDHGTSSSHLEPYTRREPVFPEVHGSGSRFASAAAQEEDDLGGGFIPEKPSNDMTESKPLPLDSASGSAAASRTNPPRQHPRYTLIVVPNSESTASNNVDSQPTFNTSSETRQQSFDARAEDSAGAVQNDHGGSSEAPITVESSASDSKSASVEIVSRAVSQTQSRAQSPGINGHESGSDYEGSLLSEDPEDEDAIPEWLM